MLFLILLTSVSQGAPPTELPVAFDVGTSPVVSLQTEGDFVFGADGASGFVLSVDDWNVWKAAPCEVSAVSMTQADSADHTVWMGCSSGELYGYAHSADGLTGGDVALDDLGEGAVRALFATADTLWALFEPENGNALQLVSIDPKSGLTGTSIAAPFAG